MTKKLDHLSKVAPAMLAIWLGLLALIVRADGPVVRAVLFWAETCPHCHEVIEEVLPPLREQYGDQLEVLDIEISDPSGYELWLEAVKMYRVPQERQGVPMLFMGDTVLVGSLEIPERLPTLIEQHIAAGGVDYPAIPGLEGKLSSTPVSKTEPRDIAPKSEAAVLAPPIHLAYFYQPGCRDCDRVQLDLNYLQHRYPQLVVHAFDVKANAPLAEWMGEQAGVPEEKRLVAPSVFIGREGLVGADIQTCCLEVLIARHATTGADATWDGYQGEAVASIIGRFQTFSLMTVLGAGVVDGLNPCAFATVVFFISYLALVGRHQREILVVGVAFTLAVFLTYLGLGLGFLKFFVALPFLHSLSRWVYGLTAAMCVALAALSLYDWTQARQGKPEAMRLKLPTRLRRWINRVIREGAGLRAFVPVAFFTGVVVSLIELSCTGQVYLPTILFVLGVPKLQVRAHLYLVLYNLMFVLPLVVVFFLAFSGTTSRELGMFINRRAATIKLATAGLFLILAGWQVLALL